MIQWLRWSLTTFILYLKNKNIEIEYPSKIINCKFKGFNKVYSNCYLSNVELGLHSYVSTNCNIQNTKIGNYCSIGPNVTIAPGKHPAHIFPSTHPVFYSLKKQNGYTFVKNQKFDETQNVVIENDVWIGVNAVLLDGVHIANGAIVAAGALVTKDVTPYTIVAGVPAKMIKKRFETDVIENYLTQQWWNNEQQPPF